MMSMLKNIFIVFKMVFLISILVFVDVIVKLVKMNEMVFRNRFLSVV